MAIHRNNINGVDIEMDILRFDYTTYPGLKNHEDVVDVLVKYTTGGKIVVDTRASDDYALWAATHEMICQGPYGYLSPEVDQECCRCGEIELMLLDIMPEELRQDYRSKRLKMLRALTDLRLHVSLEESFKCAIEMLS